LVKIGLSRLKFQRNFNQSFNRAHRALWFQGDLQDYAAEGGFEAVKRYVKERELRRKERVPLLFSNY
jgi:hypothetical protein